MYPLLIPGRDLVRVEPAFGKRPRRGDVALYRRDGDILVLHRVFRVRGDTFYAVGDNQKEIEGPLRLDQIRGYMTAFSRDGKARRVAWLPYRAYAALWLFLRPVRPAISRVVHGFKKHKKLQ